MGLRPSLRGYVSQQQHFDFLPTELVQELTERNTLQLAKADEAREKRRTRTVVLKPIYSTDLIDQIPLDLLSEPIAEIIDIKGINPVFLEMMEDHGDVLADVDVDNDASAGSVTEWSDHEVAQLHEGLLMSSMAVLAGRGNPTEKVEALKWFYRPDIFCWNKRPGPNGVPVYRPVYAKHIPFTFHRCAALMGINVEYLRGRLSTILRKAGLGEFLPIEEH